MVRAVADLPSNTASHTSALLLQVSMQIVKILGAFGYACKSSRLQYTEMKSSAIMCSSNWLFPFSTNVKSGKKPTFHLENRLIHERVISSNTNCAIISIVYLFQQGSQYLKGLNVG